MNIIDKSGGQRHWGVASVSWGNQAQWAVWDPSERCISLYKRRMKQSHNEPNKA